MKIAVFPFIVIAFISLACLNEHHVDKYGKESIDHFSMKDLRFYKKQNTAEINALIIELQNDKPANEQEEFKRKNSLAVNYIKLGELQKAETILNELIKKQPKDYSVIINLGTLYELQAKNDKALSFIKKAIEINPESHGGSEWFHVKVLEYKLKTKSNESILKTDVLKLSTLKLSSDEISSHINYQLQERIPFTPAPDSLMAKILQEYGDFLANNVSIKGAYVAYEVGMDYDKSNLLNLKEKRDALLPLFKKYKEAVPKTGNYYIDNIVQTIDEQKGKIVTTLLDKGLSYFEEKEKQRQREKRNRIIFISLTSFIAVCGATFFIAKKAKKK